MNKHIAWLTILIMGISEIAFPCLSHASNEHNFTNININIPAGMYLYKPTPDIGQNTFNLLWIIENKKIVDPARKNISSLNANLAEREFGVFLGESLIGKLSTVSVKVTPVCGEAGFPESPSVSGYYKGDYIQPFVSHGSRWGNDHRTSTSSRVLAEPYTKLSNESKEIYLEVTEVDREKLSRSIRARLVPKQLQRISAELVNSWGAKYKVVGEGNGGLVFLEKIDIDGNGKADFIGTYHLSCCRALKIDHFLGVVRAEN